MVAKPKKLGTCLHRTDTEWVASEVDQEGNELSQERQGSESF